MATRLSSNPVHPLAATLEALHHQRFFKLIAGASLTDLNTVKRLSTVYAQAGAHCIDVAADLEVLRAVEEGLAACPPETNQPLIMVSVPLDPDPHFRKIELTPEACILCGICVPLCPTEAITLNTSPWRERSAKPSPDGKPGEGEVKFYGDYSRSPSPGHPLQWDDRPLPAGRGVDKGEVAFPLTIDQPLCYGCGRCVTDCPTDALTLHPFLEQSSLQAVLAHPLVGAVEIHTEHADPLMLADFMASYGALLTGKLLSVCFRPQTVGESQTMAFLQTAHPWASTHSPGLPLIFQVDGKPMSGNDDPEASRPAIEAAMQAAKWGAGELATLTISGGVNGNTGTLLAETPGHPIAGIGMGTVARQAVLSLKHAQSAETLTLLKAKELVRFEVNVDKKH